MLLGGYKISSDGKRLNLLRYAAWLYQRSKKRLRGKQTDNSLYVRERAAKLSGRDIAKVWDKSTDSWGPGFTATYTEEGIQRRADCQYDLKKYLLTYHAGSFTKDFGEDHEKLIRTVQSTILGWDNDEPLQTVVAMPRGSGKTTIMVFAVLWAALFGHHRFSLLIAADDPKARKLLKKIQHQLQRNDLLNEDFPEVCGPIRCLEGSAIRAVYQLYDGQPTDIVFSTEMLVLPTIPESIERGNAGCVIQVGGLESAIRGPNYTSPRTGETIRPTLALVDDPQTRKSAKSASITEERLEIILSDIAGCAPPGVDMSILVTCTVIYQGDLADKLMDPQSCPGWTAIRVSMIKTWPTRMDLVEEYRKRRQAAALERRPPTDANEYWAEHHEEIEADAVVYWEERVGRNCVSALQTAINIWVDKPTTFAAEYQNSPIDPQVTDQAELTLSDEIVLQAITDLPRKIVPEDTEMLTAFIDVSQRVLWWQVVAFSPTFDPHIVAFGCWPEQKGYVTKDRVDVTLQQHYGASLRESIRLGVTDMINTIMSEHWETTSGQSVRVRAGAVDAKWGEMTGLIRKTVWESPYAGSWWPSEGIGLGAKNKALNDTNSEPKPREVRGVHWRVAPEQQGERLIYDTNWWKSEAARRFRENRVGIHAGPIRSLQMLLDQLTAEYCMEVESRIRRAHEWRKKPGKTDEHGWDCFVGAMMLASKAGLSVQGETTSSRKRRRIRFGEVPT